MYNAGPEAAAAWRALFTHVFSKAKLDIEVIEHKWPQPIDALWGEPDLCCAFMCGWPYARSTGMQAIAAPIPSPPRYGGRPRYCSEFLARDESGFMRLDDAFGHSFVWMARDSQSGFNAPRVHLARFVTARRPALFSESVGPLGNPAKTVEALVGRQVDMVALDSFYLDLVRHYQPAKLAGLRTIATTDWTAIPLLVAAPSIDSGVVARLRDHLLQLHHDTAAQPLLEAVLLKGFAAPDLAGYAALERSAQETLASGYADIR
jgi:ABC-type phosphate/phosphonate transport system substrate-binding protein